MAGICRPSPLRVSEKLRPVPGVEGFVAPNGKSNRPTNYPLWIIAISLLVIAICVVVDSIERQRAARDRKLSLPTEMSAAEPVSVADRPGVRVATRAMHHTSIESSLTGNSELTNLVAQESATPHVAMLPAGDSTVGGPQPVGYSVSGISQGSNAMGEITGRITLNGIPPPETIITTTDPVCSKRSPPLTTHTFVVGDSNGLADAVVFVKQGIDAAAIPPATNIVTVLFTNCEIQPHITAVMPRQPVNFRDRDGVEHSLQLGEANIARTLIVPRNSGQTFRFISPRLFVPVQCRKHLWETAYICVLDNPYFAVTDNNGNFDIPNIPPGTYTIEVAHQGATGTNGVTRSVIVVAGKKAELNLTLKVPGNGPPRAMLPANPNPRN